MSTFLPLGSKNVRYMNEIDLRNLNCRVTNIVMSEFCNIEKPNRVNKNKFIYTYNASFLGKNNLT